MCNTVKPCSVLHAFKRILYSNKENLYCCKVNCIQEFTVPFISLKPETKYATLPHKKWKKKTHQTNSLPILLIFIQK